MKDILSLGSESPSLITSLQGGIFQVLRKVLFLEAGGSGCEILASPKLQQVQSYKCTKFLHWWTSNKTDTFHRDPPLGQRRLKDLIPTKGQRNEKEKRKKTVNKKTGDNRFTITKTTKRRATKREMAQKIPSFSLSLGCSSGSEPATLQLT